MGQPLLKDHGFKFTRLDGTMNMKQKSNAITKFQEEGADSPMVMLLSLRAGGVGLNLNCANHMILMDPAWNPSTEDQCFDRIHRLGQTKEEERFDCWSLPTNGTTKKRTKNSRYSGHV